MRWKGLPMNNANITHEADGKRPSGGDHVERAHDSVCAVGSDNYDNYDKSYFEQRPPYRNEENRTTEIARNIWDRAVPIKGTAAERYLLGRRIRARDRRLNDIGAADHAFAVTPGERRIAAGIRGTGGQQGAKAQGGGEVAKRRHRQA